MRLIDADAIEFHDGVIEFAARCIIDAQPTVEVEPVVHAHWIDRDHGYQMCSHCFEECIEAFRVFKRCPYCGAHMDEEV